MTKRFRNLEVEHLNAMKALKVKVVPFKDSAILKPKLGFECMLEAIKAHGDTPKIHKWYKKWKPNYLKKYGIITMQYSLSCQLMSHVVGLIENTDNLDELSGEY